MIGIIVEGQLSVVLLVLVKEQSADEDVSTIYGLLRFDLSILQNVFEHGRENMARAETCGGKVYCQIVCHLLDYYCMLMSVNEYVGCVVSSRLACQRDKLSIFPFRLIL